jgi:hypothetical protein
MLPLICMIISIIKKGIVNENKFSPNFKTYIIFLNCQQIVKCISHKGTEAQSFTKEREV